MPFARQWLSCGHSSVYQASSLFYIYIICCTSADRVLNSRTRALKNKMASHPYIYIVCVRRANSELLRWSRHFNDVSFFGLLQISVTGLKILGIKNVHDLVLRTVPTIVIAHTFCASQDTRISYQLCLLIQGYFCAV